MKKQHIIKLPSLEKGLWSAQSLSWKWQNYPLWKTSWWWEKAVKIEGESVKLFISAVSFECSELGPPWHPSVFCTVFELECVVKKHRHHQCHRWGGEEDGVEEIIELHQYIHKKKNIINRCEMTKMPFRFIAWKHTWEHVKHVPSVQKTKMSFRLCGRDREKTKMLTCP